MNNQLRYIANGLHDLLSRGIRAATSLDSKRPRLYDEFGYPDQVSFDQLYLMYKRGGLAHGAVNRVIGRCWSSDPYLLDGTERADDVKETPLEAEWRRYAQAIDLWTVFSDADLKQLVGGVSAILLEAPGKWSEPVRRGGVTAVRSIWRNQLKPIARNSGTDEVTMWQYISRDGRRQVNVHPDRVFLLGDYDDPQSFIEPAYNALLNIDKIIGGVAEGTLKNAARQLAMEFADGSSLQNLATSLGKKPEETQEILNNMASDLNAGIDALFAMSGGKISPLVAQVPPAAEPFNVNAQTAVAAWQIPLRILVGNQTGERASTEDKKEFDTLCQSRNERVRNPMIRRFFQQLVRIRAIDAMPTEWTVYGEDLTESSAAEKLANAKIMADINKQGEAAGGYFDQDEVRVAAGYEAMPEGEGEMPIGDETITE